MSRSYRGGKGPGYEYWASRSNKKGIEWHPGKKSKKFTHKQERQRGKELPDDDTTNGEEESPN